jgi:hypothetical protein
MDSPLWAQVVEVAEELKRAAIGGLAGGLFTPVVVTVPDLSKPGEMAVANVLDIGQIRETAAEMVRRYNPEAVVICYPGVLRDTVSGVTEPGLFVIFVLRDGSGEASAYPYSRDPVVGITLRDAITDVGMMESYWRSTYGGGKEDAPERRATPGGEHSGTDSDQRV